MPIERAFLRIPTKSAGQERAGKPATDRSPRLRSAAAAADALTTRAATDPVIAGILTGAHCNAHIFPSDFFSVGSIFSLDYVTEMHYESRTLRNYAVTMASAPLHASRTGGLRWR